MKKFLIIPVVCLLAAVLTTTTASAQENGDGYEWVSYTKDFPLDVAFTKMRMKENIATSGFTLFSVRSEDGTKYDIRPDKSKIAGTALKKLPADGEWRVYTFKVPMYVFLPLLKERHEACGESIQFYVNSKEYSESQLWTPVHSEFPKDKIITKVRTRRLFKDQYAPYDYAFISLHSLYNKYNEMEIKYDKGNKSYKVSLDDSQYTHHTDKNGWDIYDLTEPWMFAEANAYYKGTYDVVDERNLKSGECLGYEVEFIAEEYQYKPLIPTSLGREKNPDLVVPGFPEPLVYYRFQAIEPIGVFDTKQNRYLYERWKEMHDAGYISGNKLYRKYNDGTIVPTHQLLDGYPYRIAEDDVIVSVEPIIEHDHITKELIKYENGDSLLINMNGNILSGKIHRKAGILIFKKGVVTLELPNGDNYVGSYGSYPRDIKNTLNDITNVELLKSLEQFYTGTLFKKDGTKIEYTAGKTQQQIDAENKAKAAEEEKIYRQACAKWGKKYVDAALSGNIIVGMPEDLLVAVFNCQLSQAGQYSRCYHIMGIGSVDYGYKTVIKDMVKKIVWVSNGRVSSISNL